MSGPPTAGPAAGRALLEVRDVVKRYGLFTALDGVTFGVDEGEFVSIIGPNGAGKTTLVNVLSGLTAPTSGEVLFHGRPVTDRSLGQRAALGLVRSFQLVTIFPALTVAETLAVAVVSRLGRGRRLLAALARDAEVRAQVEEIARLFGLHDRLDTRAGALAQGDKKLLDVASAVALRPQVVLLDEPTSGVSTRDKHAVMEVLVAAARRIGIRAIIQVEHDMDIVFGYSDRIVALHQGRILADGPPAAIRADADVVATVLGTPRT